MRIIFYVENIGNRVKFRTDSKPLSHSEIIYGHFTVEQAVNYMDDVALGAELADADVVKCIHESYSTDDLRPFNKSLMDYKVYTNEMMNMSFDEAWKELT